MGGGVSTNPRAIIAARIHSSNDDEMEKKLAGHECNARHEERRRDRLKSAAMEANVQRVYMKRHDDILTYSSGKKDLEDSQRAIVASIVGGGVVFVGKACVVWYCGGFGVASDSIVAETAHSFVDCLNQVFLLVGIKRSLLPPTASNPMGKTRELYSWSLLSCVVLFVSGSCFSMCAPTPPPAHLTPRPAASAPPCLANSYARRNYQGRHV